MPVTIAVPQMGTSLFRKYMKNKYVQSLRRSGAETKWIELDDPARAAAEACRCDGLLLPGGADINPALYGQEPQKETGKPNTLRDSAEPLMLREFMSTGKPILGICRGIQLINVAFGGTLHQDIKETQQYKHSDFIHRAHESHPVTVGEGTKLYSIVGRDSLMVNSIHHQAIDRVADSLIVNAVSNDGFTEGIEMPDYPFLVGVQWHPEHMSRNYKIQQEIFNQFAEACKGV